LGGLNGPERNADVRNEKNDIEWKVPNTDTYAQKLYLSDFLREPVIHTAIQTLQLPSGSRGLDAGCGIGSHTLLLAEAVAPDGHVTGLDVKPEFLVLAKETAEKSGLSERVSFQEGDVSKLPLEARLNAPSSAIAPFIKGKKPESHFMRALGWFRDAGLEKATARTFVGDVQAPLSGDIREALISLFEMLWDGARSAVTPQDWAQYQRLSQPESSDFILNLPDYYAFFTCSLFYGKVVE
jgi:demethylmenaquinone methyltransferase/2-methoxy-6-polyprenyl-1,4-benzoquinol methylase